MKPLLALNFAASLYPAINSQDAEHRFAVCDKGTAFR
jgi:hypothetical protein